MHITKISNKGGPMSLWLSILIGSLISISISIILALSKKNFHTKNLSLKWHLIIGALVGTIIGLIQSI